MTTVTLKPMPEAVKRIKVIFRPMPPPVFTDIAPGGLTKADITLARELFKILDEDSKGWYGRRRIFKDL